MDLIFIEGFTGQTVIGIHDTELHDPQPMVIDLHAGLPRARACDTDRIGDTIDYGVVRERLQRLLVEHRLQLLEAFAESDRRHPARRVRRQLGAREGGQAAQVRRRAGGGRADRARARRDDTPAQREQRGAAVLHLIGSGMVPGGR